MKPSTTSKLKGYSALVSSFFAMQGAHAQILYTDIHPDIILGDTIPGSFPLIDIAEIDLNNDGIYDFRAKAEILGPSSFGEGWDQKMLFYGLNTDSGDFNRVLMTYTGSSGAHVDIPFEGGVLVSSSNESFFTKGKYLLYGIGSAGAGLFWNKEAYAVVQLLNAGQNHLGWVRLALDPLSQDTPRLVIKDYAFNATPNEPILTGQRIGGSCPDVFEKKWYLPTIPSITFGSSNQALISPQNDIDEYKISVSVNVPNVRIVLSDLPKNYDLRLLNEAESVIATSAKQGLSNDTIVANNLPSGNYIVEVHARKKDFQPDKCYSLMAESSATPFKEMDLQNDQTINEIQAYPNPADNLLIISTNEPIDMTKFLIYDMTGRLVITNEIDRGDSDDNFQIDIRSLPEGSYVLQLESNVKAGFVKFFVQR